MRRLVLSLLVLLAPACGDKTASGEEGGVADDSGTPDDSAAPADPCHADEAVALLGEVVHPSIQSAIEEAEEGDTVLICPGTWVDALLVGKSLTLASQSGDPADTVLDGEEAHRLVMANGDALTLRGLTLQNGRATTDTTFGELGGALAVTSADLTLEDCVFTGNQAGTGGGAVSLRSSGSQTLVVRNTTISGNGAPKEAGGGLAALSEGDLTVLVEDSVFEGNGSSTRGGGLSITALGTASVEISGSTFSDNRSAQEGGGLALSLGEGSTLSLSDTSFSANSATLGGAISVGDRSGVQLDIQGASITATESTEGALALRGGGHRLTLATTTITDTTGTALSVVADETGDVELSLEDAGFTTADRGIVISGDVDVDATSCDLGTGEDDNRELDLQWDGGSTHELGDGVSFGCTAGACGL